MRCEWVICRRQARVVVDFKPGHAVGKYGRYCWPHYVEKMRDMNAPLICNYIDQGDKDDDLFFDGMRRRPTIDAPRGIEQAS